MPPSPKSQQHHWLNSHELPQTKTSEKVQCVYFQMWFSHKHYRKDYYLWAATIRRYLSDISCLRRLSSADRFCSSTSLGSGAKCSGMFTICGLDSWTTQITNNAVIYSATLLSWQSHRNISGVPEWLHLTTIVCLRWSSSASETNTSASRHITKLVSWKKGLQQQPKEKAFYSDKYYYFCFFQWYNFPKLLLSKNKAAIWQKPSNCQNCRS